MATVSVFRNDGKVLTFECAKVDHETDGALVLYQKDEGGDSAKALGEFAPGEWAYWITTNGDTKTEQ